MVAFPQRFTNHWFFLSVVSAYRLVLSFQAYTPASFYLIFKNNISKSELESHLSKTKTFDKLKKGICSVFDRTQDLLLGQPIYEILSLLRQEK